MLPIFILLLLLLSQHTALAQPPADPPVAPFTFDAATIKPSDPDNRNFGGGFYPSGSYNAVNFPLSAIVLSAYFPYSSGSKLIGAPVWAQKENYDIVGHIDEATASLWMKLNRRQQGESGRIMMQKLLAERCKLVVHTIPSQVNGFALVLSKHGSRLHPSQPGETIPDGVKYADLDGGRVSPPTPENNNTMTFFNAPIQDLVNIISRTSNFSVIQDQTNLSGRYNFSVRRLEIPRDTPMEDLQPSDLWDISSTGLELTPIKLPSEDLVIDHIERPTPN